MITGVKNNIVKLVDSRMGSSKTTKILEWMDNHPEKNYIYVAPLLSEVDIGGRVHQNLKNVSLEIPSDSVSSKSDCFLKMLRNGDSIACTHSLYLSMTEDHFYELSIRDYVLIIDEEVNVINGYKDYSQYDLNWLIAKGEVSVSKSDGMVTWIGDRSEVKVGHKYYGFLTYCDSKALYSASRNEAVMVTQLPIKLFEVAKEVIILTYMFKGNILDCFLKLKGFDVQMFDGIVCDVPDKQVIRELLTVVPPTRKLKDHSLSATWWDEANAREINLVANYIKTTALSFGFSGDDICWTAPKGRSVKDPKGQHKNLLKPRGFLQDSLGNPCYLATNTRATNNFKHKKGMFHCYNRRPLTAITSYLSDYGQPVNLKTFATSEMVQWLWRGCIRDNKPMVVVIASQRMYDYFMEWLESDN